jgi:hypothetical protein
LKSSTHFNAIFRAMRRMAEKLRFSVGGVGRPAFKHPISTMKVHPRLAMELARHSDMRLTMKTYTDAGQLPLREVMDTLPGFGERSDSRIDSRTLGKSGQTVSPSVTKIREIQTENSVENIGESHRDSSLVTTSHEKSEWRREGDSNPRYDFWPYTGLANQRLQPLGHLSKSLISKNLTAY